MKDNKHYSVEIYKIYDNHREDRLCSLISMGKIIVSSYKRTNSEPKIMVGECKELLEDFTIPVVDCIIDTTYDDCDYECKSTFIPPHFNYMANNYIVLKKDFCDVNVVTPKVINEYDPRKEEWYSYFKEEQYSDKKASARSKYRLC